MGDTDSISVLRFWFEECRPWQWFRRSDSFDEHVRKRFGQLTDEAIKGGLQHWETEASNALALVLLLDQFSRHLWREQARAFSGDTRAVQLSWQALEQQWVADEPEQARRQFWLMPLLHSEDPSVVKKAIPLLEQFVDRATADLGRRNLRVLESHGCYPWRLTTETGNSPNPARAMKVNRSPGAHEFCRHESPESEGPDTTSPVPDSVF